MIININVVPDCVFVQIGWACSLIPRVKDVTATLKTLFNIVEAWVKEMSFAVCVV